MTLALVLSEQLTTIMDALTADKDKFKFEGVSDDKIAVSYKYKGYKYLLTLQQYPYER